MWTLFGLNGLKSEYESVRAQVLGGSDIPSLPEAFSHIQRVTHPNGGSHISIDHRRFIVETVQLFLPPVVVLVVPVGARTSWWP